VPGVNLADTGNLAIASLDLLLVQDLIGAMRAADKGAAASASSSPLTPLPTPAPRQHVHLDPVIEPRRVVRLSPCYVRCCKTQRQTPILHALPRVALTPASSVDVAVDSATASGHESKLAIQPPWAVQAWQEPAKPVSHVKVVVYRTDIATKGSLIDMFI
jgi:hypothetical protein